MLTSFFTGSIEILPDISIIDPALPLKMPPRLTAITGIDALSHAIEAYTCTWSSDFTDALAIKSIQLIFEYLPKAYRDENDFKAREKLHNAATLAGLAISNSETGLAHSTGHAIGGLFRIPHGMAVGIMLPYTMQYIAERVPKKYVEIANSIGIKAESEFQTAKMLIESVKALKKDVGLPNSIKELGINEEDYRSRLEEMIDLAMKSDDSTPQPRVPTSDDFKRIFISAYYGRV